MLDLRGVRRLRVWMGDALRTIEGDYLSKSFRKAEADSRKLTHREKWKKSGDCNWDPMRRPSNARRKGVCPPQVSTTQRWSAWKVACPQRAIKADSGVFGKPSLSIVFFVCLDKSLV